MHISFVRMKACVLQEQKRLDIGCGKQAYVQTCYQANFCCNYVNKQWAYTMFSIIHFSSNCLEKFKGNLPSPNLPQTAPQNPCLLCPALPCSVHGRGARDPRYTPSRKRLSSCLSIFGAAARKGLQLMLGTLHQDDVCTHRKQSMYALRTMRERWWAIYRLLSFF